MKRAVDDVLEAIEGHPDAERCWLVGAPWFEPPEVLRAALKRKLKIAKMAELEALKRRAKDPWLERIADWLENPTGISSEKSEPKIYAKADEIFANAIGGDIKDLGRDKFIRIANVMQDLGWGKSRVGRIGETKYRRTVRGYFRPKSELFELL